MPATTPTRRLPTTQRIDSRGQLVIEEEIRRALGVRPDSVARQQLVDDHVEIRFYPAEHKRSLRGILAGSRKRRVPPEEWDEERRTAQAKAVRAEWEQESQDG